MDWHDARPGDTVSSRLSADVVLIEKGIGEKVGLGIQYFTTFIAGWVIALNEGWQLAVVTIGTLPLLILCGWFQTSATAAAVAKGQDAYARAGAIADEALSALRIVCSFRAEDKELNRYSESLKEAEKSGRRKGQLLGIANGAMLGVTFASYALILWYGAKLVADEVLTSRGRPWTGGDVMTVLLSVVIGAGALGQAIPSISAVASARGAAFSIFETIEKTSSVQSPRPENRKDLPKESSSRNPVLKFDDVYFSYPNRKDVQVLKGVNFEVQRGQTVALVGSTGSGKSTCIGLAERFYDPDKGNVYVNGVNIKDVDLKDLRDVIGLVAQQPVLFSGTVLDNIRFGAPEVTREAAIAAAKASNAHVFIEQMPQGYDTFVGVSGSEKLSGGQIQRIAIARALVRKPCLLLLDEATSALDNQSEKIVQEALHEIIKGKDTTTLVIAHRLSTIRNADVILVFESGNVVEKGNHEELMFLKGRYFSLVAAQDRTHEEKKVDYDSDHEEPDTAEVATTEKEPETVVRQSTAPRLSVERQNSFSQSMSHGIAGAVELAARASVAAGSDEAKKDEPEEKEEPFKMSRLWKLSANDWYLIVAGCFGAAGTGVIFPVFGILLARMISSFYLPDTEEVRKEAFKNSMYFLGLAGGQWIASLLHRICFAIVGERLTSSIRKMTLRALFRQEIGWHDLPENTSSALCAKLAQDAELIRGASVDTAAQAVFLFSNLSFGLGISFYYEWRVSLVVLGTGPVIALGAMLDNLLKIGAGVNNAFESASAIAGESIRAVRTVVSSNAQTRILETYSQKMDEVRVQAERKSIVGGFSYGGTQFLVFCSYALEFWFCAFLVGEGISEFSDSFTAFIAVVLTMMWAGEAANIAPDVPKARNAAKALFKIIDREAAVVSGDRKEIESRTKVIEFKDVVFNYPARPEVRVLNHLNLKISLGKTTAIVGQSGSGKSTIAQLLQRFYDPDRGEVLFDGVNLKEFDLGYLRSQISYVSQDAALFDIPILNNVEYAHETPDADAALRALEACQIKEFVDKLPQGLETRAGMKGGQFSGVQRQRIAISRAMRKNANILILDEATSALDNETEMKVQQELMKLGGTIIVIAHRLSTIKEADEIVVMGRGKVRERGTHDELMAAKGIYFNLVNAASH